MEKKKIYQIVVIVACFSIAGYIVYSGLYSSPPASSTESMTTAMPGGSQGSATVSNSAMPSPGGSGNSAGPSSAMTGTSSSKVNKTQPVSISQIAFNVDISKELKKILGKKGLIFGNFSYPKLDETDIGLPVDELIKPLPEDSGGSSSSGAGRKTQ